MPWKGSARSCSRRCCRWCGSDVAAGQQPRRWQSFRDAAAEALVRNATAEGTAPVPTRAPTKPPPATGRARGPALAALAELGHRVREHLRGQRAAAGPRTSGAPGLRRRTDLRLVPAALLVWGTALAAGRLEPAAIAGLCAVLAASAVALLLAARTRDRRPATRSLRATAAAALLLSGAAGAHAAVASVQRHDGAFAEAVAAGASVVAELEVAGVPRRLAGPATPGTAGPGLADRWAVPATAVVLVFDGRRVESRAGVVVLGGPAWGDAEPGQRIRTTGRLKPAGAGEAEAGLLSASSAPVRLSTPAGWARAPAVLRSGFREAAAGLPADARGLLPGMVTGDTAALDPQLAAAMKTVGMTHLTAVSGANCSLVLGALLLAARSLRLPRPVAAGGALAGLGLFVLMVGPDASVLRAACMGAIGLAALVFGRAARGLSLLCVASTGLLVADPALAADVGFLLSVLATLGIVVAGRPMMDWLPGVVPRAVAAGVAVPLSAQLFCGPVIVLLQPQFSSYALPANLAAAALVPPVTLVGTAAVPLVPLAPALAAVPLAVAGAFASGVAGIARCFAALPGAALPWPEGAFGLTTMALLSGLSLTGIWLAAHPAATVRRVLAMQERTVQFLVAVLDREARPPATAQPRNGPARRGLVHRPRRGRLRVCKPTSRRNHEWLLPRPNAPGPRRRTPPPGAM